MLDGSDNDKSGNTEEDCTSPFEGGRLPYIILLLCFSHMRCPINTQPKNEWKQHVFVFIKLIICFP